MDVIYYNKARDLKTVTENSINAQGYRFVFEEESFIVGVIFAGVRYTIPNLSAYERLYANKNFNVFLGDILDAQFVNSGRVLIIPLYDLESVNGFDKAIDKAIVKLGRYGDYTREYVTFNNDVAILSSLNVGNFRCFVGKMIYLRDSADLVISLESIRNVSQDVVLTQPMMDNLLAQCTSGKLHFAGVFGWL